MAYIQCGIASDSLQKNTTVHLILPSPTPDDYLCKRNIEALYPDGNRWPTLYLLHGSFGGGDDWLRRTNVERYAEKYRLALVMPSVENSRYTDMHRGENYLSYITRELPVFMQTFFPLSKRRENTYIAGLSMGGYGAFLAALTAPGTFCRAASLSGSLDVRAFMRSQMTQGSKIPRNYLMALFEDPLSVPDDYHLPSLIKKCLAQGMTLPELYMSCGLDDYTLQANDRFHEEAAAHGVSVRYDKHPGAHDWNYWDTHINDVMAWMTASHE